MKTNVQVYRDTENKILEILTKCVKTLLFFPLLSRYFRACEIDPLMHNECLVCTCFQALVVWRFCMCTCLYPKHSFQHKHFAWLKVNSYKSKQGPGKSLKSPRTFRLKKCMNPTCHVLYMHTVLLLTICTIVNRDNMRISILIFFDHHMEKCSSLERHSQSILSLCSKYSDSYFFHCPVLSFQCKLW